MAELACELFELEPAKRVEYTMNEYEKALRTFVDQGGTRVQLLRAALALAFGAAELSWRDDDRKSHLAFLEKHGYKPTDRERKHLRV